MKQISTDEFQSLFKQSECFFSSEFGYGFLEKDYNLFYRENITLPKEILCFMYKKKNKTCILAKKNGKIILISFLKDV